MFFIWVFSAFLLEASLGMKNCQRNVNAMVMWPAPCHRSGGLILEIYNHVSPLKKAAGRQNRAAKRLGLGDWVTLKQPLPYRITLFCNWLLKKIFFLWQVKRSASAARISQHVSSFNQRVSRIPNLRTQLNNKSGLIRRKFFALKPKKKFYPTSVSCAFFSQTYSKYAEKQGGTTFSSPILSLNETSCLKDIAYLQTLGKYWINCFRRKNLKLPLLS